MKKIFFLLTLFICFSLVVCFTPTINEAFAASCTSSSGSDFNCCQADADTSGTKITLSNTNEATRKCSWPANTSFTFTIKRFGLLPKDATSEAEIVWIEKSVLFNAGAVDANSAIGNYLDNADFPHGTYVSMVPELALEETVQASTAPTITYDSTNYTCTTNEVTHQQQPGDGDVMCAGQSAITIDEDSDGNADYTVSVGTFGFKDTSKDYPNDDTLAECFTDDDGDGTADTIRIYDWQLGDIVIDAEADYNITFTFNVSDGVLFSVFQEKGWGDISSPIACTAVDVGDLDVTITYD